MLLSRSVALASLLLSPAFAQPLIVAAASDLAPLGDPLSSAFQQLTGHPAQFVLGSSGMLARQIRNGAPYDVFLSANELYIRELEGASMVDPGSARVYALGRIGLWSKRTQIQALKDLLAADVRHLALPNPEHAPYGVAAKQVLENQKLWRDIQPRVVYGENVRQAFEYAQSGNADAVLTAWSLLYDKGGILLPETWHEPIRQAGAVLNVSARKDLARRFLELLTGAQGRKILETRGFTLPK
jgi:molybdate transport system substrate-binding protein